MSRERSTSAALEIGDRRVSLLLLVKGLVIFAVLVWLGSLISNFTELLLRSASDLTPTYQVLIAKFVRATAMVFAIVVSMTAVGN